MTTFKLPDLGEGLQEAEIVEWHVSPGEHVVADQPLVAVETDKAVVEIPSPQSGHVAKIFGKPGDILKIGAPLVEFAEGMVADLGTVVGAIPAGRAPSATPRAEVSRAEMEGEARAEPRPSGARAAPAVRALAEELGVDLATVKGSGPGGAIGRADVERAAARGPAKLEPLRGVRRAMAHKMARAHAEVVPTTVTDVADIGAWRAGMNATLRLIRAIARACRQEPALNAWYFGPDQGRELHGHIDLGIAMDTPDGLFVPVLRDVARRSPENLRHGLEAMKRDVKARSVPLEELRGQTITLSNFGMFGGQHATLVVVPPQVAIIGAGRIHDRVVPVEGKPAVRRALPLSLTFDHRAVMGGEAARFLAALVADLEATE